MELRLAGYDVQALSIGGVETCYEIPAFDVCLDIGRCPPGAERRRTLLLTHGHIDHAAGLPYYVSMRSHMSLSAPRVYCPSEAHAPLTKILEAWTELQADTNRCTLTGVNPGDTIPLANGNFARVFRSPHRIACTGYTLFRRRKKLKPELVGLPTATIAERVRAGDAYLITETPEICFPGDTTIEVVAREELVRKARVLMLECTFMDDKVSADRARNGGHVHLDDIVEHAHLFENEVLLLTHISKRYSAEQIRSEVDRKLPASLRERVQLLIHVD